MPAATAAVVADFQPVAVDLCFTREDSFPFTFTLEQPAGTPIDLTGSTFLLTVATAPGGVEGGGLELFSVAHSNTPGVSGVVEFTPSQANMDEAEADYFFDVQWTDASANVRTVIAGGFAMGPQVTQ